MTTSRCNMCGQEKGVDQFRQYKSGKLWPYCKECQAIEVRRKYLEFKVKNKTIIPDEVDELVLINRLYNKRVEKGLNTFGKRKNVSVSCIDTVLKQIEDLD